MKYFLKIMLLILFVSSINAQQKHAMTIEEMWKMNRIGNYDLSPDGKTIVFAATAYDMEKNKGNSDLYIVDADGQNFHPLKNTIDNESSPKFSPDGQKIAYEYKGNIWLCDLDGKNETQLTNLYTGASGLVWSKDGKKILFISSVYPDCTTQECNEQKDKAEEQSKVKAKIFTELMYRHWNEWRGEKRSHLFLLDVQTKDYVDLTLNSNFDVPPIALGSDQDYSFSPDGNEVAFTMNTAKVLAASTNNDIFIINLADAKKDSPTPYKKISKSEGNDNQPVYSPDGKFIAFRSMAHAGFEADKQTLMLYNRSTGEIKNITQKLDISIGQILFSHDGKFVFYDSDQEVNHAIYKYNLETNQNISITKDGYNTDLKLSPDEKIIYFKKQKSILPTEIFSMSSDGGNEKQLTFINRDLLSQIEFGELNTFWSQGAQGAKVQSIIVKPPFFNPAKKYPLIFLIHGGPQGNWPDEFHFRWNLQLFASKGYVVVATNPRGSTGYGQKFTDEISGDWGGKVFTDLMNAYDYALKNYKFIDSKNTFAAGASFGGYMINWLEGHVNKFNAVVSHDGVYNIESMYGSTEELWFPEWEMKGAPWENRTLYERWSPNRFVKNFKTPMLIVHGALDFRLSETQGFELFTALQRKGVPSKLLYFPDEFHFVAKPQNARLWWNTIFDWFDQYKK